MMAKSPKFLRALALCLCAMLLCGSALAEFDTVSADSGTNPAEQADVSGRAWHVAVPYLSYDTNGKALGSADCTSYTMLRDGNSSYYDLDESNGGWYVVGVPSPWAATPPSASPGTCI